jgi:hypothetical protein
VLIHDLLTRAQDTGAARADLTPEDVTLVLLGVAQTMTITGQASAELWRRHLAMVLDGMRAEHTQRLPGLPASTEQLNCDLRAGAVTCCATAIPGPERRQIIAR